MIAIWLLYRAFSKCDAGNVSIPNIPQALLLAKSATAAAIFATGESIEVSLCPPAMPVWAQGHREPVVSYGNYGDPSPAAFRQVRPLRHRRRRGTTSQAGPLQHLPHHLSALRVARPLRGLGVASGARATTQASLLGTRSRRNLSRIFSLVAASRHGGSGSPPDARHLGRRRHSGVPHAWRYLQP